MSLECTLERIAGSLEVIAKVFSGATLAVGGPVPAEKITTAPTLEQLNAGEVVGDKGKVIDATAEMAKREEIKKELRALGIKFKEAARTETLEKQLVAAKADPALSAVKTEPAPQPETAQTEISKEQLRDALVELSTTKGKDAALKILREAGKAEKLSEVKPENFSALLKACKEAK